MREKLRQSFARFRDLVLEYGIIAIIVNYVIFAIVIAGFWFAIKSGARPETATGTAGTWAAAYFAAKLTQPLRLAVTFAVTPFVARVYERVIAKLRKRFARSSSDSPASPPGDA